MYYKPKELPSSSDLPDFVTTGGKVSVQEGGKITLPCQVNDLGSRTVSDDSRGTG